MPRSCQILFEERASSHTELRQFQGCGKWHTAARPSKDRPQSILENEMMVNRLVLWCSISMASALSVSAQAGDMNARDFVSCVGRSYHLLTETNTTDTKPSSTHCFNDAHYSVCRRLLRLDEVANENETAELTITKDGSMLISWREQGDPSYSAETYALSSDSNEGSLVVATLQSETQGMGAQEWLVSVIQVRPAGEAQRASYVSSEFGEMGSLVRPKRGSHTGCHLLRTQWITKRTPQGERLFLEGQLVPLAPHGNTAVGSLVLLRRLDHSLTRMRERSEGTRPLKYFQK